MILCKEEAIHVFNKLPTEMQSYYFHPEYVINDALYKKDIEPIFFVLENKGMVFYHAFHFGKIFNTSYYDIQSPYGYGGPICLGDKDFIEESIQIYKKWCSNQEVIVEFIRFHPLLKNQLEYYGQVFQNRPTVYIDLKAEDLFSKFSTRVRTAIRKAKKSNLRITFSKSQKYINEFIRLYTVLMNEKAAEEDYFFNKNYFIQLIKSKNVYLLSVENENDQVIGSSIFFISGYVGEYHLSASNEEGRSKNVANLLIYEFAEFCKKININILYLGGGNDCLENNSLLFFKRGFSKNEELFYIGNFKHNQSAYDQFRTEYTKQSSEKENYILFYR
ncbi:GNAT family N-acetyltransferase [Metabacillus fastidiosus]|uniref:GNAT family N-acetyltransferase n=1 Tax=Metabacillus fastidiosus TaxID=1458 RepID=UPI0008256494|nr:GNAT family N-acetyltransferase [Metabacillus fastidiosus]MED4461193.1 GNAT family N-acetyltransferase [Metabacillus fastidiosus]